MSCLCADDFGFVRIQRQAVAAEPLEDGVSTALNGFDAVVVPKVNAQLGVVSVLSHRSG